MTDQHVQAKDAQQTSQTKIKRARRKSQEHLKKRKISILKRFGLVVSPLTLLCALKLYHDSCDDPDHPHRQKRDAILTLHPDGANLKNIKPNESDDEVIYEYFDLESQKQTLLSTLVQTGEDMETIENVMKEANQIVRKSKNDAKNAKNSKNSKNSQSSKNPKNSKTTKNSKNPKTTRRSDTKVFLNATVQQVFKGNFPTAYWLHTSLKYNSQKTLKSGQSIFKVTHKSKTLESLVLTDTGLTYITRAPKTGRNQKVLLGSHILKSIDDGKLHYLTLRVDEKLLEVFVDCQRISRHETLQSRHKIPKKAKLEAFVGKDAQLQLGSISIMNSKIAKLAGVCCDNQPSDCECLVHPKIVKINKKKNPIIPPRVSRAQNLADLGIMKLPCEVSTIIGEKGGPGKNGRPGKTGKRGKRGNSGKSGAQGRRGPKGPPGVCPAFRAGVQGMKGHRGKTGPVGNKGPIGKQGWPGESGKKGEAGIRGLIGPKGPSGRQGVPGSQGEVGVPGKPGEMGQEGRQGDPGESGENGKPGSRGPARRMPDLDKLIFQALQEELPKYIKQLKKQCSRSCASMLSRQTHSKRGKPGPAGNSGPRGFKGDKGDIGHAGERGFIGLVGAQGAMGVPGEQGWPGEEGRIGKPGVGSVGTLRLNSVLKVSTGQKS